jgi:hypothetical protein
VFFKGLVKLGHESCTLLCMETLHYYLNLLHVIGLFRCLIYSFFSILVGYIHLGIYQFHLYFPVYLNVSFQDSLDFIRICGYVPLFTSDFINLMFFLLCFVMLTKGLLIFSIFSKNRLFVSLCSLFGFDLLDLSPDLYYFSPSGLFVCWLVFVCSCFSRTLRCIIRSFI